jgi:hypothetical protein
VQEFVLGEFYGFTLFCEEKLFGGIGIWVFLEFWSVLSRGGLRRGDIKCFALHSLGKFSVKLGCSGVCEGRYFTKNNCRGGVTKRNLRDEIRTDVTGEVLR